MGSSSKEKETPMVSRLIGEFGQTNLCHLTFGLKIKLRLIERNDSSGNLLRFECRTQELSFKEEIRRSRKILQKVDSLIFL